MKVNQMSRASVDDSFRPPVRQSRLDGGCVCKKGDICSMSNKSIGRVEKKIFR